MFKEMMDTIGFVTQADPEVGAAMEAELKRQRGNIELIASENIVSPAVMAAMGSVLTNKYAEGIPATATTADASAWTWWRTLPATARAGCSAPSTPMCSHIRARRPIWPFILRC